MTLQSSGQIKASEINTELGNGSTDAINLGASIPRLLSQTDGGGEIQLSDFYSRSSDEYSMTSGDASGSNIGYADDAACGALVHGSLSPTTFRSNTIRNAHEDYDGAGDFAFKLDTVQAAQSYFYALTINGVTLKTASVTAHTQTPSGVCIGTKWRWDSAGTNLVTSTAYTMNVYW